MKLKQDTPSRGPIEAPLAGGVVEFGQVVDVPAEDAVLLLASGHFVAAEAEGEEA